MMFGAAYMRFGSLERVKPITADLNDLSDARVLHNLINMMITQGLRSCWKEGSVGRGNSTQVSSL